MKQKPELPKKQNKQEEKGLPEQKKREYNLLKKAQANFTKNLKNIDFELSYFRDLKQDQPELFKFLSNIPKNKKIIQDTFLRGVKYDIKSVVDGIKEVFPISDSIYDTEEYKNAVESAFVLNIQGMNFSRIDEMTESQNFPHEIFSSPKVQSDIAGLDQFLKKTTVEKNKKDPDKKTMDKIKTLIEKRNQSQTKKQ